MSETLKQLLIDLDSMEFVRPFVLMFLIIPVSIAFWEWVRKGQPLVMPFDRGDQRPGWWLGGAVNVSQMFPQLLMAIAIVILAGPQKPGVPEDEKIMANINFCLDISGSMRSGPGGSKGKTRYELAVEAMQEFTTLEGRKGDSFGLSVFGVEIIHWVPVTQDLEALHSVSTFISPNTFPRWFGGTMIGKALRSTAKRLQMEEEGDRMIILLSDGMSSDLIGTGLTETIKELKEAKVSVYMVLFQSGPPNKDALKIARDTGGAAFNCSEKHSVYEIFKRIDEMEKANFKAKEVVPIDFFEPAIYLGLCFLAFQLVLQFVLRYTPW
jgi:Ca-activated chloride channel family protein